MTTEQLARLHELVHAAQKIVERPWEPGEESRPIEFFTDHLDEEGWGLGWTLVAALRESTPDLFGLYGEEGIHRAALDHLLSLPASPSIADVADALRTEAADDEGVWLTTIPLANAVLDRTWVPLGESAALVRSAESHQMDHGRAREQLEREEFEGETAVFRHLGDRLSPASRVLRMAIADTEIDTGRTVSLLDTQPGPRLIAIEAARAKAQYALATWAVLKPPADWHLLPDLAIWTPQPYLQQRVQHKRLEQGNWIARDVRGVGTTATGHLTTCPRMRSSRPPMRHSPISTGARPRRF